MERFQPLGKISHNGPPSGHLLVDPNCAGLTRNTPDRPSYCCTPAALAMQVHPVAGADDVIVMSAEEASDS
jgi:hypothetical protein